MLALGTHDPDCDWQEFRRAAEAQAEQAAAGLGNRLKKKSFVR